MQYIGLILYIRTILFGRSFESSDFVITKIIDGEGKSEQTIIGDFIVTVGKRAVIITESTNDGRSPIITKRWKGEEVIESDGMFGDHSEFRMYEDVDGRKWTYTITTDKRFGTKRESLHMEGGNNGMNEIFLETKD